MHTHWPHIIHCCWHRSCCQAPGRQTARPPLWHSTWTPPTLPDGLQRRSLHPMGQELLWQRAGDSSTENQELSQCNRFDPQFWPKPPLWWKSQTQIPPVNQVPLFYVTVILYVFYMFNRNMSLLKARTMPCHLYLFDNSDLTIKFATIYHKYWFCLALLIYLIEQMKIGLQSKLNYTIVLTFRYFGF